MSDFVSRTSLILDLTDFAALEERLSAIELRPRNALDRARRQLWLAALVVIAAAAGCYLWGMRLLAAWQWQ
ncbi:MAG TPA: hypothetical protein VFZ61_10145 [Polyangiales bacterium]